MNTPLHTSRFAAIILIALLILTPWALAQEDQGSSVIGKLEVTVYFGTDADPAAAGERAEEVSSQISAQLQSQDKLKFTHYRTMGAEKQSIFRSYENWAQPLRPSDEILVRFETRNRPNKDSVSLDLELWLANKKILKTDATLGKGRPLFILGPKWRGGALIISVALAPE